MKEFKVNEYLTLKLVNDRTIIYVKDEEFMQCKSLLLEITVNKITSLESIESIDEAAERLDIRSKHFEGQLIDNISPETEFWGHSSNLQTWFENSYDTRLLHRNLAFSLLKKLTDVGDSLAKKVFKDEIAKRISSGYIPVIRFLVETRYLDFFTEEEVKTLFQGYEFVEYNGKKIPIVQNILDLSFREIKDLSDVIGLNKLISLQSLDLGINNLTSLPDSISNLKALQYLDLTGNNLTSLPESIYNLKTLKSLSLGNINLSVLPESIYNLSLLQSIDLHSNNLSSLPEIIGNLTSLKKIYLYNNQLTTLPESISNLTSLQKLSLNENQLKSLPKSICNLTSLRELDLNRNQLSSLPESIGNLTSLQTLNLSYNQLTELPDSIENLTSLQTINLKDNQLKVFPETIKNLTSLQKLNLQSNKLTKIPEEILNIPSLKKLYLGDNPLDFKKDSSTNRIIEQLRQNGTYVSIAREKLF